MQRIKGDLWITHMEVEDEKNINSSGLDDSRSSGI